jgi:phosphatidate cytidylyltransferase
MAAASGATVRRSVRADARPAAASGSLRRRVLSSLALAPPAVAAAWFGWPWLPLLTALAALGMAWEWARLCRAGALGLSGFVLIAAVLAAIAAAAAGRIGDAIAVSGAGSAVVFAIARGERGGDPLWLAVGGLWLAVPCVLLLWLARTAAGGRPMVLWIFAIVWATDIGAYAAGRRIGGPRLAPRWSPQKTWAGLAGGALCAALAGWATAGLVGASSALPLVLASAGLALVEQFGDLAESVAKRRFGVKDSSGLIPGHGGLLDRLDGLLAVVPAAAAISLFGGGMPAWR